MRPVLLIPGRVLLLLVFLLLGMSACQGLAATQPPDIYIPPTLPPSPTPVPQPTPTALPPTSIPECRNNLVYLEDLTIQDGTLVSAGQVLDKRWRVSNTGSCNWAFGYTLQLIAGPSLGATTPRALFPAVSGSEAVIEIEYIAPDTPGIYRSAWQAFDPQGLSFGDPIFIEIVVVE